MSLTATLKYGNEPMGTKSITENGTGIDVSSYAKVNVDVSPEVELQDKTVTTNGTVTADEGYDGLDTVTVNVQPSLQNKTVTENGTVQADSDYYGLNTVTVNVQPTLQTKSATPSESAQEVTADSGYDGLEKVNVGAIPSEYIVPSGTLSIVANGDYDITEKASVTVNVPNPSTGSISIVENGTYDVTDKASAVVDVPSTTVEQLNVSMNGTYTAESGKAYSPVVVNVANSIPMGDYTETVETVTVGANSVTKAHEAGAYFIGSSTKAVIAWAKSGVDETYDNINFLEFNKEGTESSQTNTSGGSVCRFRTSWSFIKISSNNYIISLVEGSVWEVHRYD